MAQTQEVRCNKRCRDNATMRRYFPGDIDDIDPSLPIAMYFEGWKDGTKVYHEVRGTKDRDIKVTTRTIGKAPGKAPAGDGEICDICDSGPFKNLAAHQASAACKKVAEEKKLAADGSPDGDLPPASNDLPPAE